MRNISLSLPLIAVVLGLGVLPARSDGGKRRTFEAELKGIYEIIPAGGAVSTVARGSFRATLSEDATRILYRLRFSNLESDITQAHIHVGQFHTTGGISVWLCGTTLFPGPTDTPPCGDPRSDTVEGELMAENVIGPSGQGVAAGEFEELVRLIRSGVTYANVHTSTFTSGEIRGQIRED